MPVVNLDEPARKVRLFNGWVRQMLRERKKSQEELADYLGLFQPSLSRRLENLTPWRYEEVLRTEEFFGEVFKE